MILRDLRVARVLDVDQLAHLRFGADSGTVAFRAGLFSSGNFSIYHTMSSPTSTFGTEVFRIDSSNNVSILVGGLSVANQLVLGASITTGSQASTALSAKSAQNTNFTNNPILGGFYDSTAVAAGVGGGLVFGGIYTGSTVTEFGYIGAVKLNSSVGDYSGKLILGVRKNGSGTGDMSILTIDGSTGISTFAMGATVNGQVTINNSTYLSLRSGGSSTIGFISMGRTGEDARITVAGATNDGVTGSAVGDVIYGANATLWLGSQGIAAMKVISGGSGVVFQGSILGSGGSAPSSTTTGSNVFTAGLATSGPLYAGISSVTSLVSTSGFVTVPSGVDFNITNGGGVSNVKISAGGGGTIQLLNGNTSLSGNLTVSGTLASIGTVNSSTSATLAFGVSAGSTATPNYSKVSFKTFDTSERGYLRLGDKVQNTARNQVEIAAMAADSGTLATIFSVDGGATTGAGNFAVSGTGTSTIAGTLAISGGSGATGLKVTNAGAGMVGAFTFGTSNSAISFDTDYSGVWTARSTSAGIIYNTSAQLQFYGNTGLTNGNTFTPTQRLTFDYASGNFTLNTGNLVFTGATTAQGAQFIPNADGNGFLIQDGGGNRWIKFLTGTGMTLTSPTTTFSGVLNVSGTGTSTIAGTIKVGTDTATSADVTIDAAGASGQGGFFGIQSAGVYKSAYGLVSRVVGGTDASTILQSYADNVYINAPTGKSIIATINSVAQLTISATTSSFAGIIQGTKSGIGDGVGGINVSVGSGSDSAFSLNQAGVAQWSIAQRATSGLFVVTQGGTDWLTIAKTTGVTTFASTTSGTSTTAAAILGKSLGLTENLYVGGRGHFNTASNAYQLNIGGSVYALSGDFRVNNPAGGQGVYFESTNFTPSILQTGDANLLTSSARWAVSDTTEATTGGAGSLTTAGGANIAKTLVALHISGNGTNPSGVVGAGAGTLPSAVSFDAKANDVSGVVTVTTGTVPTGSAAIMVVTFSTTYATAPHIVLFPANAATALLSGVTMVYATASATTFTITSGPTGLAGATAYSWNYVVVQ